MKCSYQDGMLDITGPVGIVEVEVRAQHGVLWVNIEGICVLRICKIDSVIGIKKGADMKLVFSDGVEIETSGEYEIKELKDGWYIIGKGLLIPVDTEEEGKRILRDIVLKKTEEVD